jgi:3-hydroxyacyl-CoA dehydrogenase
MGLHAMYDLAGLDIGWDNRKAAQDKHDPAERYVEIADRICERGWFGQKTGRGFYLYPGGARIGTPDPEILALIEAERAKKSIVARKFTADEIMARYVAAMVNEACEVLRESVALKPSDIDVTFVHGYGFPRYRGGPMKYADSYGLGRLLGDIRRYGQDDPIFWQASPLLEELVASGQTFDDLNKG